MGMFDDALKKSVPGGNLTKPLVIAAGALILAKWLGGGKEAAPAGEGGRRADEIMPPDSRTPLPGPSSVPHSGQGMGQGAGQGAGQARAQQIDLDHPGGVADEGLSGGLGGFLDKLRKGGLQQEADSWVGHGPNKPAEPAKLGAAVGQMTIKEIAQKAGTTEEDIVEILTQVLPQLVDNLTPQGRVPTQQEVESYGRRA